MDAHRYENLRFDMAPLGGRVRWITYLLLPFIPLLVIVDKIIIRYFVLHKAMPLMGLWTFVSAILIVGGCWYASLIRELRLEGNMLFVRLSWWTNRFDLTDLQSIEADPKALKGARKGMGNDGLGSCMGRFRSKRLGPMRVYVSDPAKSVVLRWADRCVVVSPKNTDWFIESVRKRTGLR